jgi:hypothetical protein
MEWCSFSLNEEYKISTSTYNTIDMVELTIYGKGEKKAKIQIMLEMQAWLMFHFMKICPSSMSIMILMRGKEDLKHFDLIQGLIFQLGGVRLNLLTTHLSLEIRKINLIMYAIMNIFVSNILKLGLTILLLRD